MAWGSPAVVWGHEGSKQSAAPRGGFMTTRTPPLLAVGAVMLWASAAAQSPSSVKNLSIPAEPLANALNDLAQQSGLQVMFASELVARLKSPEVKGVVDGDRSSAAAAHEHGLALRVRESAHDHHRRPRAQADRAARRDQGAARGERGRSEAPGRESEPSNRRSGGHHRRKAYASSKLLRATSGSVGGLRCRTPRGRGLCAGHDGGGRRRRRRRSIPSS